MGSPRELQPFFGTAASVAIVGGMLAALTLAPRQPPLQAAVFALTALILFALVVFVLARVSSALSARSDRELAPIKAQLKAARDAARAMTTAECRLYVRARPAVRVSPAAPTGPATGRLIPPDLHASESGDLFQQFESVEFNGYTISASQVTPSPEGDEYLQIGQDDDDNATILLERATGRVAEVYHGDNPQEALQEAGFPTVWHFIVSILLEEKPGTKIAAGSSSRQHP